MFACLQNPPTRKLLQKQFWTTLSFNLAEYFPRCSSTNYDVFAVHIHFFFRIRNNRMGCLGRVLALAVWISCFLYIYFLTFPTALQYFFFVASYYMFIRNLGFQVKSCNLSYCTVQQYYICIGLGFICRSHEWNITWN